MNTRHRSELITRLELNRAGAAHLEAKVKRLKVAIEARRVLISKLECQLAQMDGKPCKGPIGK
jgi:hypothetical protein